MVDGAAILEVDSLNVSFARSSVAGSVLPAEPIAAVREVSLSTAAGECLGIVGESGSGKTQLFLAAMGLLPANASSQGSVRFEGREILGLDRRHLNLIRGVRLAMVFQDPMTSLTPHLKIGVQLAEVRVHHAGESWSGARAAALRMLERVRIPEAARRLDQYPHELSGGLRQRAMIGMSLMCDPVLLIADEPTTALDVTVQAQIIDLLRNLRAQIGMSLVMISHDLAVVGGLADRIAVMYAGRVVESSPALQILRRARHPYTAALLECTPSLTGPLLDRVPTLPGQPPSDGAAMPGCAFAPRCPRAAERCRRERPLLLPSGEGSVACHYPICP